MLIDGNSLDRSTALRARYCVIGSGMGGMAVAQTLASRGEDVLVVEAGGPETHTEPSPAISAEHAGRPFGIPLTRCIELGGTSNQWHGICGTLDDIDFEPRPWIRGSGWPIRRSDLDSHYRTAAQRLEICDTSSFDTASLDADRKAHLGDFTFEKNVLQNKLVQFRKPPKRWKDTLVGMARSGELRCLYHAAALELIVNERGDAVERLVVGVGDRTTEISADVFIVCAGGLETPRLLLNSNRRLVDGIGNEHGMVGRHLLDHPVGHFCKLGFHRPADAPLYASMSLDGAVGIMSGLIMSPESQARWQLPNHYLWVRPSVSPARIDDDVLYSFLAVRGARDLTLRQIWAILTNRDILYRVLVHRFGMHPTYRYGDLFFMTEQLPNAESCVGLSSRRDRFGYPIARVHWDLAEEDFRAFERYAERLLGDGLRSPQYTLARVDDPALWRKAIVSAAHHLGTARMADSPRDGVVDRDLRVFGMENVFVSDASVFATAGGVNPSLTITALGVRLGEHLLARRGSAASVAAEPAMVAS